MNEASADPPQVLRCRSTSDFLAALPRITGFTARDSIILVFFSGKRAGHAMRIDLPESEHPRESVGLLEFVCEAVLDFGSSHGAVSAPAIAICTEQTFAEADGPPWRRLARRLERRLRREGVAPRELCCVAPDGWISYLDPSAPTAGRPLSEIDESPIALEARLEGVSTPDIADLGAIPDPDPARRGAVAGALAEQAPFDFPGPGSAPPGDSGLGKPPGAASARRDSAGPRAEHAVHPRSAGAYAWMVDTAEVVRALRDEDRALEPSMAARLIRCAEHSDRWLLLAMGVLTRPEFPVELAHEMGPAQFAGVPVDVDPDAPARAGWSIRRILASICPEFTDLDRIPHLRRRLTATLGETPRELRPGLLAFSAWVWWLGGTQSVAHRQALEALEIDPDNEVALMVERLVSHSLYAPRARHEASAA
ncbi:DUF4192 family protein [Leucobacter sp. wl10]|uniref:DUF4192 family protein n=1 Tax=Leucobacter sp. wl10 TaxID=2304677 RepID=UPI000E5C4699|nr:DUF4192 family protein [Leucobacter sp. wl10]RGE21027.1 DUF4192 family protein [Leucobacter sp. wl10]